MTIRKIERTIIGACVTVLLAYALAWVGGEAPCIFCAQDAAVLTGAGAGENKADTQRVKRVIDGDTIELESGEKVRYIGINTPESVDPRRPVQCFGKEAASKNKELVLGKEVRLVKDVSNKDAYGRLLRYVYIGDLFINLELVRLGYATASSYPPDIANQDLFRRTEQEARQAGIGLWDICR